MDNLASTNYKSLFIVRIVRISLIPGRKEGVETQCLALTVFSAAERCGLLSLCVWPYQPPPPVAMLVVQTQSRQINI